MSKYPIIHNALDPQYDGIEEKIKYEDEHCEDEHYDDEYEREKDDYSKP